MKQVRSAQTLLYLTMGHVRARTDRSGARLDNFELRFLLIYLMTNYQEYGKPLTK